MKRLDGALDEGSEKEAGIGAALDGKLEQGCRLVGAGVDGEKNWSGNWSRGVVLVAKRCFGDLFWSGCWIGGGRNLVT